MQRVVLGGRPVQAPGDAASCDAVALAPDAPHDWVALHGTNLHEVGAQPGSSATVGSCAMRAGRSGDHGDGGGEHDACLFAVSQAASTIEAGT